MTILHIMNTEEMFKTFHPKGFSTVNSYLFFKHLQLLKNYSDYGASSGFEPTDMEYGDRQGGVADPQGYYWGFQREYTILRRP